MPACSALRTTVLSLALISPPALAQDTVRPASSSAGAGASIVEGTLREWFVPKAADFASDTVQLTRALQTGCDAGNENAEAALQDARQRWLAALTSWERLYAVAAGPLNKRRSQRQIDFNPTRPSLIAKAVQSAPQTLHDLELVGTPAKGLPALEWLLWEKRILPAAPECDYAVLVASEVEREAHVLRDAYQDAASRAAANDGGVLRRLSEAYKQTMDQILGSDTPLSDLVNHWAGGIERLSWLNMVLPVRVTMTTKRETSPEFPRRSSGATAASWAAQWEALHNLAVAKNYSIETELRRRGQIPVAEALVVATKKADMAMQGLQTNDASRVLEAGRELAALKQLMEDRVAPALDVRIGFSDADGD